MKTIAVVCEKGGTGKSVIANELYESYVRQGAHSEEDAASNLSQFYFVQALPGLDRSLQGQMEEAGVRQEVIDAYKEAGGLPYLDNRYTVFGQVYEGMDVVDAIAAVDTDENDKPTEDVLIEKVELAVYSTSES